MSEQVRLLPGEHPDRLVERAKAEHAPIATFCLFSGGNDSMVTAHRCHEHYEELVWIDTGTALPGVAEFVQEAAEWIGKPLRVMRHDFDAFRAMVVTPPGKPCEQCHGTGRLDWLASILVVGGMECPRCKGSGEEPAFGFPGPPQHGRAYIRLKERMIDRLLREAKVGHPRSARVLSLTGVRRAESKRRSKREPISRKRSMVFVNPLIDWTNADMLRYRTEHELPESPVAALLHRSGECNCGCFADEGEREMIQALWPEWFEERIASLEREAEAMGLPCATWGKRCEPATDEGPAGELCSTCEHQLELTHYRQGDTE